MSRRRMMMAFHGDGELSGSNAQACDVVFASNADSSLHIVHGEENWPDPSEYTPIGIVVIPGRHNVYGNGTCGVMSLKFMNFSDPDNGTTDYYAYGINMNWGNNSLDISGLTNYNKVITTSSNTTNTVSGGLSSNDHACIPKQTAVNGTPTRNNSPYAPSPYVGSDYKSGGHNALYSTTAENSGSNYNVLADFDGVGNTKIITDLSTSWKRGTISNSYNTGVYPAAQTCARYKTVGTKSFKDCTADEINNGTGFWYLPAAGELGYIMPRLYDINATISALQTKYGSTIGALFQTGYGYYWSSSECSSSKAYNMDINTGRMSATLKNASDEYVLGIYPVRAFLRL